jgi:hypothetical protein
MPRSIPRTAYMVSSHGFEAVAEVFVVLVGSSTAALIAVAAATGDDPDRLAIVGALSRNMVRRLKLRPNQVQRL